MLDTKSGIGGKKSGYLKKRGVSVRLEIDSGAAEVVKKLENAGYSAYIVGGAVRDLLMDRHPHNYEIVTDASPMQIKAVFKRTVDTKSNNFSVTVIENYVGYDVSTFRGSDVGVTDITGDLSRRDFTVNAMAYNDNEGICDIQNGIDDIKNKLIRCVGNEKDCFFAAPIRMIKAVRFSVQLGFELEENTRLAIIKYAQLIKKAKPEKIRDELNKILLSDNPEKIVMLHELGLMQYIIPELERCFGEKQKNKYHIYDVGMHIMKALENVPKDLAVCWAVLLHDVGKPNCSSTDANGIIHFYGHHKESQRIAVDVLHRFRFEKEFIRCVSILVENHDVRIDPQYPSVKRMMAKVGEELFEKLLIIQSADSRAKNPLYIEEKIKRIDNVRMIYRNVLAEHQPYMISNLAVTSKDLLKIGFKAGRETGDILRILLDDVVISPELNKRDYLLQKAKILRKKKGSNR